MFQLVVETTKQARQRIINETERKLILECQQGQLEAFKSIYKMHSTMLYSIAMRILGVKEDAEDAMQNCFTKLYRSISQFKGHAKLSSYLVRILMNCCYDILSKRERNNESANEHLEFEGQNEWSLSIEKAIGLLPLKMRECFILFAVEGFKQVEIAEMLEISEGAVKAHVFQAKVKLRKILK